MNKAVSLPPLERQVKSKVLPIFPMARVVAASYLVYYNTKPTRADHF
jgi:hypothetical protein